MVFVNVSVFLSLYFKVLCLFLVFRFLNSYPCHGATLSGVYWGRAFRPYWGRSRWSLTGVR